MIKLLAIAKRYGDELEARVHPTLLPSEYLLSSVSGAYNAIYIEADLVGKQLFWLISKQVIKRKKQEKFLLLSELKNYVNLGSRMWPTTIS